MSREQTQPSRHGRSVRCGGGRGRCGWGATVLPDPTADQDEVFNLDDLSDSDSAATPPLPLPNDTTNMGTAASDNTLVTPNSNITADLLMGTSTLGKVPDIDHFFDKQPSGSTCKVCNHYYKPKTGNSSLWLHISVFHLEEYIREAEKHGWPSGELYVSPVREAIKKGYTISEIKTHFEAGEDLYNLEDRRNSKDNRPHTSDHDHIPPYSMMDFQWYLVNFIVADDQSLNVVECPEFRNLLLLLRESLKDLDIPHWTHTCDLIINQWYQSFLELQKSMKGVLGNISFTTNIWSDSNLKSYLAMTGHWISEDPTTKVLHLECTLVAFHRLRDCHTGESLANTILYLLDRMNVTDKTGHFTMDNAENNTKCVRKLGDLLAEQEFDIAFDPDQCCIMCHPHLINLCAKHACEGFTKVDISEIEQTITTPIVQQHATTTTPVDEHVSKEAYIWAIQSNPLDKACALVRAICASGLQREAFQERIRVGNAQGWHKYPPVTQVPLVELLREVLTRWDTIFFLLNQLRILHPAIDYFVSTPEWYEDLGDLKLSPAEWLVLSDFKIILKHTHLIQQTLLSESQPHLSHTTPIFELLMSSWEKTASEIPRLKPWIDHALGWVYKYYKCMDNKDAYVLAMFVDPNVRLKWIKRCWGTDYVKHAEDLILRTMTKYREAKKIHDSGTSEVQPGSHSLDRLAEDLGLNSLSLNPTSTEQGIQTVEQEYHKYISAEQDRFECNPFKYWEIEHNLFPTVFLMAMDYLPIQASSVPCERVFSSSAETDTKKRNHIGPVLMEALQMLKFSLKKSRLNFTEGWQMDYNSILHQDDPDIVDVGQGQDLNITTIKSIVDKEDTTYASQVVVYN